MAIETRKRGKKITMFLMDGDPSGLISVDLSNWSGKSYKIPRTRIADCKEIDDLSSETSTGVYFLFGKSEDEKDAIYIGETEGILTRLKQHLKKEFWNEAIVFIGKDLNKAHVKYLESRFCVLAIDAGRYVVLNKNTPTQSNLSMADEAEMDEFIENARLLVPTLGHKAFEDKRKITSGSYETESFVIKAARGADAMGQTVSDGFLVFKGSKVAISTAPSTPDWVKVNRDKLQRAGVVKPSGKDLVFTEDHIFSSPSTAATTVMGRSANGLVEWKLQNGTSLKDVESRKASE